MKKLMLFLGLFLALFSTKGQSIRDYSTKDVKDYNIFLRPFKADLKVQVSGQVTPKQFLGNISLDTIVKSVAEKVVINPVFTGATSISKTAQSVSSTTSSGGFFLKNPDVSYTGIEMGVGNSVAGGAWIQARSATNTTGQILTLNPTGGNVGIGISNGAKTLSVNGSIGFGALAAKDLQTELNLKANSANPTFTGNSSFVTQTISGSINNQSGTINGNVINSNVSIMDQANANILSVTDALNYGHAGSQGMFMRNSDGYGNIDFSFVPYSSLTGKPTTIVGAGFTDFNALGDSRYTQKSNNLSDLSSASTARANLGIGNIENTSDANKPISTATNTALGLKVDKVTGKQLSTEDFSTAEKNKLAGVASGATANSTDAILKDRANHTGLQSISTVTGLQTALDATNSAVSTNTSNIATNTTNIATNTSNISANTALANTAISTANSAVSIANTANLQGVRLGAYNAGTNTPALTTDASAVTAGGFYDVTVAGTQSVTGSSTAYGVGDRLVKVGSVWQRLPASDANNSVMNAILSNLNKDFVNRFDKNSKALIAGYIQQNGSISASGTTIANGVTIVTNYIEVKDAEVLYLNNLTGLSFLCFYDKNFNVVTVPSAAIAATFTVPSGYNIAYIRFTVNWGATGYISTINKYYDFGLKLNEIDLAKFTLEDSKLVHRNWIELYANTDNLAQNFTSGIIADATTGELLTGQHGNNYITNKIAIPNGSSLKVSANASIVTSGLLYVAEYDYNHKFIQKTSITKETATNDWNCTVSATTAFVYIGFNSFYDYTTNILATKVIYTSAITKYGKVAKSSLADVSDVSNSLNSAYYVNNISKFLDGAPSSNSTIATSVKDSDGYVITALNTSGFYCLYNLGPVAVGEKYQITVYYELIALNCASVALNTNQYFGGYNQSRVLKAANLNKPNIYSYKTITVTGTNNTASISLSVTGSMIDSGLGYYAKVRIRNVSVILIKDANQVLPQNFDGAFGKYAGKKLLNFGDLDRYNAIIDSTKYTGYNIVRADNVELNNHSINGFSNVLTTGVTNIDILLSNDFPSNLMGTAGYLYYKFEITLESLNADSYKVMFRMAGGDEGVILTRADIGIKKTFQFVRYLPNITNGSNYILFNASYASVNGATGYYGASLEASLKVNDYTCYVSQNKLPSYYVSKFFAENHHEMLINNFVKEPIKSLTINGYGHSIMEHNFMRYISVQGYDFPINIYGLRGAVSTAATGTGACDTYGVMTDNADVILTLFGQHDFGHEAPLGTIGTLDKATYIGAYEVLIKGLIEKYPNKIIIVCTDTPRNLTNTDSEFLYSKNASGLTMRDYADALIKLCNFYSIPVADLYADCGVNTANMTGHPNLYVQSTATDNFRINSSGALVADATYFVSDFIAISQAKKYGTPSPCYFAEYNSSNTFIRLSTVLDAALYPHTSTAKIKLVVPKTEVISYGTSIGISKSRFWFSDLADARMPDRIHPNEPAQRNMGISISLKLKAILEAIMLNANWQWTLFNNAD